MSSTYNKAIIMGLTILALSLGAIGAASGSLLRSSPRRGFNGGSGAVQLVDGGGRPSWRRIVLTACSTGLLAAVSRRS